MKLSINPEKFKFCSEIDGVIMCTHDYNTSQHYQCAEAAVLRKLHKFIPQNVMIHGFLQV